MTEPSLDAASETPAADYQAAIAALRRMVARLEARVEQLEQPMAQWLP
jgi:ubiquinone biosynthesis protein UbiJ